MLTVSSVVSHWHLEFRRALLAILLAKLNLLALEFGHFILSGLHKAVARSDGDLSVSHHRPQCWLLWPIDPIRAAGAGKIYVRKIAGL